MLAYLASEFTTKSTLFTVRLTTTAKVTKSSMLFYLPVLCSCFRKKIIAGCNLSLKINPQVQNYITNLIYPLFSY